MNSCSILITSLTAITTILALALPGQAVSLIGLTRDNTLLNFDSNNPTETNMTQVTGVTGNLLGIDFRSANGQLYGLTDTNNLYTINPGTGAASLASSLSVPFNSAVGSGIDFNPAADRLRIVGSNDQNFRINVDTGETFVDRTLTYANTDVNFGTNPNITAAAYTNSFLGAPSPAGVTPPTRTTQLFNIDSNLDALVLQNPPNDGGLTTIGTLGVDFSPTGGFDIFTDTNGVNTAFAASDSTLYSVDLSSGAATLVDSIGGSRSLVGLAATPVPEPDMAIGSLASISLGALALMVRYRRRVNLSL